MDKKTTRNYCLLVLTILIGLGFAFALPAIVKAQHAIISRQSSGFGADDNSDPGSTENSCPGFPITASNQSELDHAITCYKALVGPGTFTITLKNNIDLSSSTPAIDNPTPGVSLYLDGANFTVDGQDLAGVRPFQILSGTHATMADIMIMGGNTAALIETGGGGIHNTGHLTLMDSSISDNHAIGDGGGVKNDFDGNVTIKNSTIINNSAEDGGGIYNTGLSILTMTNSIVASNTVTEDGGGIKNTSSGKLLISDSRIIDNSASGDESRGGGIYLTAGAQTTIVDSSISGNKTVDRGGGLYITSGHVLTITNSTISENTAVHLGGGMVLRSGAWMTMTNSTISGNQVTTNTLDIDIGGGGIAQLGSSEVHINYSTIVSNTTSNLGGRDGIYITETASLTMTSSIVANHIDDCKNFSSFTDGGYNLVEDGTCITTGTSLSGDALVGPLQNNGGKTRTHALLDGSQAIDHIPSGTNGCGTTIKVDQRGYVRPGFIGCDVGAYERTSVYYQPVIFKE